MSAVFDRMCVSERSWQAARDRLISERDVDSLSNPTQVGGGTDVKTTTDISIFYPSAPVPILGLRVGVALIRK